MTALQNTDQGTTANEPALSFAVLYETMHREIDALNSAKGIGNDELNTRCTRVYEMRDRISEAPARSLEDVAVKLRELEFVIQEWGTDTQWHEPLLRTAREGIERLSGEAQS